MTKVPHHVGFVSQQSADKIGDLSIYHHRFCQHVCTRPKGNSFWLFGKYGRDYCTINKNFIINKFFGFSGIFSGVSGVVIRVFG